MQLCCLKHTKCEQVGEAAAETTLSQRGKTHSILQMISEANKLDETKVFFFWLKDNFLSLKCSPSLHVHKYNNYCTHSGFFHSSCSLVVVASWSSLLVCSGLLIPGSPILSRLIIPASPDFFTPMCERPIRHTSQDFTVPGCEGLITPVSWDFIITMRGALVTNVSQDL